MVKSRSRYAQVSRRAMLKGSVGFGAIALVPGLGCGAGTDSEVFAGASAPRQNPTPVLAPAIETPSTSASAVNPAVDPAPPASTAPPSPEPTPSLAPQAASALAAGALMAIDFSYVPDAGGKNLPPYLAVWVEDSEGNLFDTIELWYKQSRKGRRWLPDLKRWFSVDQARIDRGGADVVDVISGATRLAGAYSVAWDGVTSSEPAPPGDYFICIESARERGPYSLIREAISLEGTPFEQSLTAAGELQGAAVSVRV